MRPCSCLRPWWLLRRLLAQQSLEIDSFAVVIAVQHGDWAPRCP
ncbi:hypothetical protein AKJ09_07903 [Labilithrix luteola]|uniref:Uncharacterized protein n=1 Tax=Labilithrix luteola TaxID=1391654 RepID=A0A0K1Q776_9BACT|nr:hypothetical protein AKJ09_07903 [Labilithrix luteola]